MSRLNFTVTVDDDHVGSTQEIAGALEAQGFVVDRVVARAGAIFGSAEESLVGSIGATKGVQEVRASRDFQLPPVSPHIPQ